MENKILNLTQHSATFEQVNDGVYDLEYDELQELKRLLTFTSLPTYEEVNKRAQAIAQFAYKRQQNGLVMIGGALWLMYPLIKALANVGLTPIFSYSERESEEEEMPDGSVRKIAVFKHKGFVPAW